MEGFRWKRIDELCSIHHGAERVSADAGSLLWVGSESRRRLEAGPYGVRILAIGCAPGGSCERRDDFRLAARA